MVPMRWVSEALGAEVHWDEANRQVTVHSKLTNEEETPAESKGLVHLDQVALSHQPVELQSAQEVKQIPESWESIERDLVIEIKYQEMPIELYADHSSGATPRVQGIFKAGEQKYKLPELGFSHDAEAIAVHPVDIEFTGDEVHYYVIAGVGAPVLGYRYVIYEAYSEEWFIFYNWGIPESVEFDNGEIELLLQFEGRGMNPADIHKIRFQNQQFEKTSINEAIYEQLSISKADSYISSTINEEQAHLMIDVHSFLIPGEAQYMLQSHELLKVES